MRGTTLDGNQIGSSQIVGVHTKILFGDPSRPGFYSILLFVPAHTTIQAHSHHDDRMATVVSGVWSFGYGGRFDVKALKTLPPGSVYSEPAARNHLRGPATRPSSYTSADTAPPTPATSIQQTSPNRSDRNELWKTKGWIGSSAELLLRRSS